jgi:hypothetical protein
MLLYKHTKQLRSNKSNKQKRKKMTKKQTETKIAKKTTAKKVAEKTTKVSKKEQDIKKAKTLLTNNGIIIAEDGTVVVDQVTQDFRSAVLVLSLAINLVVFVTYLILMSTTKYDTALISALLPR